MLACTCPVLPPPARFGKAAALGALILPVELGLTLNVLSGLTVQTTTCYQLFDTENKVPCHT